MDTALQLLTEALAADKSAIACHEVGSLSPEFVQRAQALIDADGHEVVEFKWPKAVVELTEEECSVTEDLRLAADGYSSEHEMTLRSVADKIDAAKAKRSSFNT